MKYPAFDEDGEPLVYHRLTGLGSYDIEAVLAVVEQNFVLQPLSERGEEAEMHGVDPVDVVAGDDSAVFLTPLRPLARSAAPTAARPLHRYPGVAFRLSALLGLGAEVTVRAGDLQNEYLMIVENGELRSALRDMEFQVDDIYASNMAPLEEALRLVRLAEVAEARAAVFALADEQTAQYAERIPQDLPALTGPAADSALEFLYEFHPEQAGVDFEDDEDWWAEARNEIEHQITEAVEHAFAQWRTPRNPELLVWGEVPLGLASYAFDAKQMIPCCGRTRGVGGVLTAQRSPARTFGVLPTPRQAAR